MPNVSWFAGREEMTLMEAITDAGLTSGLVLCLDAGDASSYDPAVQTDKWLDVSGNGCDFYRGTSGAADAASPTFNGSAGGKSANEYFSFDGGDYFTYDSANEAWMDGLNSGSSTHSFLSVVSINTDDIRQHIFGTSGSGLTASDVGVIVGVGTASGSRAVNLTVKNANVSSSGAICTGIAPNAWAVVGAGFNGAGTANSLRNNDTGTFSAASSYYTASPAAAPFGIGCRTPNDQPFSSGAKMAMFAMWSVTLTQTQLRSLFARIHTRFGL